MDLSEKNGQLKKKIRIIDIKGNFRRCYIR